MRFLILISIIFSPFFVATAATDEQSVYGTHWVQFQPVQVQGEKQGCQVTFLTVTADRAYLGGAQVAVNGSILFQLINNAPALALKVGLKEIQTNTEFERPQFAYIQTATASTAKAEQQIIDGEPGYKLFLYGGTDPEVLQVLKEMLDSSQFSIGYNRKARGVDVLVPLDLRVVDSSYTDDLKVKRTRSPAVVTSFASCISEVLKFALERLEQ